MEPKQVIDFWVGEGPERWFAKDMGFDARCRDFEAGHHAAARGEFASWASSPDGALALILLLDQFPRNLYRGSAHAFATDGLACAVAERAIDDGFDRVTSMPVRIFFYLPLEHAEDIGKQARCVALMEDTGNEEYVRHARLHRDIIAKFGRFPHRNASLGRRTTATEQAFLDGGGFAG
ncbi:MAG: DUF924 domain-containing protein [Hyphomonadaceae bacterium]|nr:DUF924 domain-containing protein [Hyphomonadaceae bacterium]